MPALRGVGSAVGRSVGRELVSLMLGGLGKVGGYFFTKVAKIFGGGVRVNLSDWHSLEIRIGWPGARG